MELKLLLLEACLGFADLRIVCELKNGLALLLFGDRSNDDSFLLGCFGESLLSPMVLSTLATSGPSLAELKAK